MRGFIVGVKLMFTIMVVAYLSACGSSSSSQDDDTTPQNDTTNQTAPALSQLSGTWSGLVSDPLMVDGSEVVLTRRYTLTLEETDVNRYTGNSTIRTVHSNEILAEYVIDAVYADTLLVVTELSLVDDPIRDAAASLRIRNRPTALDCLSVLEFQVKLLGGPFLIQQRPEASVSDCARGLVYAKYATEPESEQWHELLPDCPCQYPTNKVSEKSLIQDDVGRVGEWQSFSVRSDYHPGATSEIRWVPNDSGAGQQCTYDSNQNLITGGLAAGTPDTRSPGSNYIEYLTDSNLITHIVNDAAPFSELACSAYLENYPPNNGNNCPTRVVTLVPPRAGATLTCSELIASGPVSEIPMASEDEPAGTTMPSDVVESDITASPVSYTDPHLVTLDGLGYSFQAVGEFVLMRSEIAGFEVQARQARYGDRNSQASVNVGFAFNLHGNIVSIVHSLEDELTAYIDGEAQSIIGRYALSGGGSVDIGSDAYEMRWSDGSLAIIKDRTKFLNLSLGLSDQHVGRVSGLLGNFDSDSENDLITSAGFNLTANPSASDLYGVYADSWRVTNESSLFHYFNDQNTDAFTDLLFPSSAVGINDLAEADVTAAKFQCELAGVTDAQLLEHCILDIVLSGDSIFLNGILEVQSSAVNIVNATVTGKIGVASLVCENPVERAEFNGSLTNPDATLLWDMALALTWCGEHVSGEMNIITDGWEQSRRLRGTWVQGQLNVSASYPFNPENTAREACYDMSLELTGDESALAGSWAAANCRQGGEINVVRQ